MSRILPLIFASTALLLSPSYASEFEVSEEYVVTPAVKPGLVQHPLMATLDDTGRLFVADTEGLNLNKEELLAQTPGSIRLLTDTDHDGVYDKATTFADNLTFPQGALWVYDSLYVMSPPGLWRFADRDGDGFAEEREELATGFDFTGNAADVHGPFLHPNGRLFWCHGRKGYAIPDNDTGQIMLEGKGARIWSSQLSGGEVEIFAGGGMDNPVELDFTDEGEIIGTVNLFYGRPRGDTLTQWVHGGVYPRHDQEQAIESLPRTGDLLKEVHNFGHAAVSGMTRYRSGKLNPEWTDEWLTTHFNTARLTRTKLVRNGSGFISAGTEDVLRMTNPDAHLTDVLEDHGGDLLVIDTGSWFRIGCPTSHLNETTVPGGIYRLARAGVPYEPTQYPKWETLTSEAVSHFLAAEEDWLRERAGLELAGRGDPAIPELRRILQSDEAPAVAKQNAVWVLAKLKFSESTDLILDALTSPYPGVREAAANAISVTRSWQSIAANEPDEMEIELARNRTITGALTNIVRSDEPAVARQAAVALGRMAEARAIGAIMGRLGRIENDSMLEHSLIYSLIEIDDIESTRVGLDSENPRILTGILRALGEMPSGNLEFTDILPHLDSSDTELRRTAADLVLQDHFWDAALANLFFGWMDDLSEERRETLETIVPEFAALPPMQDFLTSLLNHQDPSNKRLGLELISKTFGLEIIDEWKAVLRQNLSKEAPEDLQFFSLRALSQDPRQLFEHELNKMIADENLPRLRRLLAARALIGDQAVLSEPAFALLAEILMKEEDTTLRSKAVAILRMAKLTAEERFKVAELAHRFTPVELPSLMQIFRLIENEEEATALAEGLANSPAFASIERERLREIFRPFPTVFERFLKSKLEELESKSSKKARRLDLLLKEVKKGEPAAGKRVFESGRGSCIVCHQIGEKGGRVGPNLSTIGRIRNARELYESIVYPNESIARDFNTYEVRRTKGRSPLIGLIDRQSSSTIQLVDAGGQRILIPRNEIESLLEIPTSLMPGGLEQTLSSEELRDLVSYLLGNR
ncbi:MAG: c-type cytochrome [Verrucomicrobiales bacterium]|nr:c-type cytochrome [Verrucomicrobiales bacterium]